MQQWIDCAMPCTDVAQRWVQPWLAGLTDGKVRVRVLDVKMTADALSGLASAELQGVHVCLLPVCPDNLSWVRTLLGQVRATWSVPVLAMTHALRAVALRDLLALRVADFMRVPACPEELRVRLELVLAQAHRAQLDTLSQTLQSAVPTLQVSPLKATPPCVSQVAQDGSAVRAAPCADGKRPVWQRGIRTYAMGSLVARPHDAEAARVCSGQQRQWAYLRRPEASRPLTLGVSPHALEAFATNTATRCALHDEPLKQAKSRVVQGFEKAYLTAVLNRYGGNITQAARAAKKNRRAFWELVRKYHIDLSAYRALRQTSAETGAGVDAGSE